MSTGFGTKYAQVQSMAMTVALSPLIKSTVQARLAEAYECVVTDPVKADLLLDSAAALMVDK